MIEPEKQEKPGRNPDGTFAKGFSGNPAGKPRRKTFRDYFSEEDEAELMERVKASMSEKEIMRMIVEHLFGKPRQNIGLDGGEDNKPIAILNAIQRNDSNTQDTKDQQED